jgi:hypothetical protein
MGNLDLDGLDVTGARDRLGGAKVEEALIARDPSAAYLETVA